MNRRWVTRGDASWSQHPSDRDSFGNWVDSFFGQESSMDAEDLSSRVEEWFTQIQEEVDMDKETIEAVNTFIVVAAFIAGVQAQVITFTLALPRSALQRAANLVAFLGLVSQIVGTFLGALHSILLQRRSKNKSLRLQRVTLFKADLRTIIKWYTKKLLDEKRDEKVDEGGTGQQNAPLSNHQTSLFKFSDVREIFISGGQFNLNVVNSLPQPISDSSSDAEDRRERVQRVQAFFQEIQSDPLSSSQGYVIGAVMNLIHALSLGPRPPTPEPNVPRQTTQLFLTAVPLVMRPAFAFGNIPLISMAFGVVFLMISTILLSAASQVVASEVWISCTGVLLVVMVLSLLPFSPWMLKEITSHLNPN